LLQARALIALGREDEAQGRVDAAEKPAQLTGDPKRLGEQRILELELKLHRCQLWPSAPALSEAETIDQLEHRGQCLEESLLGFERLVLSKSEDHVALARLSLQSGFESYLEACESPPAPVSAPHKKPFTSAQKSKYRSELVAKTGPACAQHAESASQLLRQWESTDEAKAALGASKPLTSDVDTLIHDLDEIKPKSNEGNPS
jgi:hypothetical protein